MNQVRPRSLFLRKARVSKDNPSIVSGSAPAFRAADAFALAIWFGLAGGIVEAFSLLIAQHTGWMSWESRLTSVDHNIVWVSPLFDLCFLVAAALLISLAMRPFPRLPWQKIVLVLFPAFAFFVVLSVTGRIPLRGTAFLALGLGFAVSRCREQSPPVQLAWFRRTLRSVCASAVILATGSLLWGTLSEQFQLARLPAPQPGRPSILLIVLDTLRADRLGSYGYHRQTTPFLDEFARRSVRFENAIAPSSWTLPSHISLFTGRLPSEHGATIDPYDGRFPTLAEVLASKGYATAGFVANSMLVTSAQGMDRGFIRWENIFTGFVDSIRRTSAGRIVEAKLFARFDFPTHPPGHMDAPEVNRRFLRWLDARPQRPFFAFLNYLEMHEPYNPPAQFASKFLENFKVKGFTPRSKLRKLPDAEAKRIRDGEYDATLAHLDAQLRSLFEELQRRKLDEDIIVAITSDHGQSLGRHGLIGHRTSLYRQQIWVPLLIAHSPKTPPGFVVSEPVGLGSVPATLLELVGLDGSAFPGPSLAPLWADSNSRSGSESQAAAVSELAGSPRPPTPEQIRRQVPSALGWAKSLVTSRWHLILQQNGKVELYDWENDRAELHDLADVPGNRTIVEDLRRKLEERLKPYDKIR